MKPLVAFCPADHSPQNEKFFNQLQNSLRKFHSEEELPLIRVDLTDNTDPHKWYRATPLLADHYLQEYETVIKLDCDQIITGPLTDIWQGDFDVATVLNDPTYPIQVLDIAPYYNNGLVVMKSREFVKHWQRLCLSEHFLRFQFREQDLLNILCSDYLNYDVKRLENNQVIYGEYAKPLWAQAKLIDGKLMAEGMQINVIHFGGGNSPDKGNIKIRFQKEVVSWLEQLIK